MYLGLVVTFLVEAWGWRVTCRVLALLSFAAIATAASVLKIPGGERSWPAVARNVSGCCRRCSSCCCPCCSRSIGGRASGRVPQGAPAGGSARAEAASAGPDVDLGDVYSGSGGGSGSGSGGGQKARERRATSMLPRMSLAGVAKITKGQIQVTLLGTPHRRAPHCPKPPNAAQRVWIRPACRLLLLLPPEPDRARCHSG